MLHDGSGLFRLPPSGKKSWNSPETAEKEGAALLFLQKQKAEAVGCRLFFFFHDSVSLLAVYLGYRISGESAPLGPGTFKFSEDRGDFLRSAKGRD